MCVCPFLDRYNGGSNTVENPSNAAKELRLSTRTPVWQSVSATVAVLSQSSGRSIERPFFAMRRGHVVYNNCALYMLLYKQQCRGFYCCSKSIVHARSVF